MAKFAHPIATIKLRHTTEALGHMVSSSLITSVQPPPARHHRPRAGTGGRRYRIVSRSYSLMLRMHSLYNSNQTRRQAMPTSLRL